VEGAAVTSLPLGLVARPLRETDLDAVVSMVNTCELHDTGEVMLERADLVADAGGDGFDPSADWTGVFDGDRIVGWGLLVQRHRLATDVHPDVRGRGVGAWLRAWSEDRARAAGSASVVQVIDDRREDVASMLTAAGYSPDETSWILRMDHPDRPARPVPPRGIELRASRPDDEDDVLLLFERAFSEWPGRQPTSPAAWRAMVTDREGFEPEDLIVALADGIVVGGAFLIDADEIWVDKLAVESEFRHRGIARALLLTAFGRSFDRGYAWTALSTDSRSGALSLYERIGMRVHRSFTRYGLDLSARTS
jgi:GNAT superfamily N-acetyltransferase